MSAYHRDLRRFYVWLAGRRVVQLTIQELADYAGWLHEHKLAPASIARHLASLRIFFRYLQLEGLLRENLAELLGSQKLWERVPHVLSPAMVEQLLESPLRGEPLWRRDRALLELLYATGCRASELSFLKLADLHLDEGFCLCKGKGDKERIVPLGRRAILAVRHYDVHLLPAFQSGDNFLYRPTSRLPHYIGDKEQCHRHTLLSPCRPASRIENRVMKTGSVPRHDCATKSSSTVFRSHAPPCVLSPLSEADSI